MAPEAQQKLLVLHLKLHNSADAPVSIDFGTLQTRLTDTDGKTVAGVGRLFDEEDSRNVAADLAPEADLRVSTFIATPARSVGKMLAVGTGAEQPEIVYDLSDAGNLIKKLTPPFVASADPAGAIALEQVAAHSNMICPLASFDATFLGASRSIESFADMTGPYWVASLRVRNRTLAPAHFDFSTLNVKLARSVIAAGQESRPFPEKSADAPFSLDLQPGAEVVVRYPFSVPVGENPARLTLVEGNSRVYVVEGDDDLRTK